MWQNLAAFTYEEEDWSEDRFYPYLVHVMKHQENLPEIPKRRAVFLMFDRHMERHNVLSNIILHDTKTWQDLNLFCGQTDLDQYLVHKIDRTYTIFGTINLCHMIAQSSCNVDVIQGHQAIIKEIVANKELMQALEKELSAFQSAENFLVSCWTKDLLKQAVFRNYFSLTSSAVGNYFNDSPVALNVKSFIDHQQRIMVAASTSIAALLLPVYGISQITKHHLPQGVQNLAKEVRCSGGAIFGITASCLNDQYALGLLTICAGLVAGLHAQNSIEWASDNFSLDKFLFYKMKKIALAIQSMKKIDALLDNKEFGCCHKAIHALFHDKKSEGLAELLRLLSSPLFTKKSSVCSNIGTTLVAFRLFHAHKEEFEDALIELGQLDAYVGLAKLYQEHENSSKPYCFVEFQDHEQPHIKLDSFWNPFVCGTSVITNSIELGGNYNRQNMIVTGPNAGGKSTTLKAMALNVIMAQSFGMAAARRMIMTPFDAVMSYLNIVDDLAAGTSLFKAQVLRVQSILDFMKELSNSQKCFLVADEMFNGTSPQEAQACAFAVAQELGNYGNNINVVATHYAALTTLEALTTTYANYHVSVTKLASGELVYPFVILPGTTDQHIALDILQNEGFKGSIIENATRILSGKY